MDNNSTFHQDLLLTLQSTYLGKSTEEIKAAESKLKQYEIKALESLSSLQEIVLSNDNTNANGISLQLKKALVNYLNKIIITNIRKNTFNSKELLSIISIYITRLLSSNQVIDESLLALICLVLNECLSCILVSNDFEAVYAILKAINAKFNQCTSVAMSLYQMLISSKSANEATITTIQESLIQTIHLIFTSPIDANNTMQRNVIRKTLDLFALLIKKLAELNSLQTYLDNYITLLSPLMLTVIQAYTTESNNIVTFINKDLNNNNNDMGNDKNSNKEPQTVLELNTIKAKCLNMISSFIKLSNKDTITNDVLLTTLTKLLPALFQSLTGITQNNKRRTHVSSQENLKATGYDSLIYQSLLLITRCMERDPFYSEFSPNYFKITFTILFQFLCTTKSDIIEQRTNFESYYTAMIDAMHTFQLKNIKTIAGFLLSFICDRFESLALKILAFIFQLLQYDMNEIDPRGLVKYPLINNELGSAIVKGFPIEYQIDTCLFFMCILAKHTLKNKEIKMKLKEFLIINQARLHEMTSVLIKYKICLIYGLCLDMVFVIDDDEANDDPDVHTDAYEFIYKSIEFLLGLIFNFNLQPSLSFQALHSLESLIPINGYRRICNVIIRKQMENIINSILTIKIDIFFDVLCTIVTSLDIEEWMLRICQLTVQRFLSDLIDAKYTRNEFLIRELNVIKVIIENTKYNEAIEQAIIPILSTLHVTSGNDGNNNNNKSVMVLTDEITAILLAIARNDGNAGSKVQPILFKIFPCYISIIKSDEGLSTNLFQLLNYIIVHDKDNVINQSKEISQLFNQLIKTSISSVNEYLGDSPSPLLNLLLIQIWLMNRNHQSQSQLDTNDSNGIKPIYEYITTLCNGFNDLAELYKENINDLERLYDLYIIWLYLSAIYSSFLNYPDITLELIYNNNIIDMIIVYTSHLTQCNFFPCKLAKCIILGLCRLLNRKECLIKAFTSVGALIRVLFMMIKRQYKEEVRIIKLKAESELSVLKDINALHKDIDDEDEDEGDGADEGYKQKEVNRKMNQNNEERQDNEKVYQCIDLTEFDFTEENKDEFALFGYTMSQLNTISEMKNELKLFEEGLNDEDKKLLQRLLVMKRITINDNPGHNITIPRKICKVKRPSK